MNDKKLKTYILDGKTYQFNFQEFSRLCTNMSKAQKVGKTSTKFLVALADKLDTPIGTIKGWMYGNSGPESLDKIKEIAKCMHQSDYLSLLILKEEDVIMLENLKIDERTKDAVVALYSEFTDAIEQYRNSRGYTSEEYNEKNAFEIAEQIEKMNAYICKNRVFFPREIITKLLAFYEDICTNYFETTDEAYVKWLGNDKDNGMNMQLFINDYADTYYDTLDEILINYLP